MYSEKYNIKTNMHRLQKFEDTSNKLSFEQLASCNHSFGHKYINELHQSVLCLATISYMSAIITGTLKRDLILRSPKWSVILAELQNFS